ncbi:hypothetical protein NFI96_024030 [Prochilodus magdalenae]|nr:hypothetical protein NFI96_024030 [Prochilodus magdalenae]
MESPESHSVLVFKRGGDRMAIGLGKEIGRSAPNLHKDQKHPQADTMSKVTKVVVFALPLIGWATAILACVLPMWRGSVVKAGEIRGQILWEGLWMSCVMSTTGQWQCKAYDSMLSPPSELQAARDMIVIAIITAVLPLTLSIMGAKCTNFIKDKASMGKVMIISGVFFMITGCMVLISVSWITTILYLQHLGPSLYIGYAAAALLITGGVLLCCTYTPQEERAITSTIRHHSGIGAVVLALIGWSLSIATCVLPQWKVTPFIGDDTSDQIVWEGLWMSCVIQSTGQLQCKVYDSMLALPLDLQTAQVMFVVSNIITPLACIFSVMGTRCMNCTEDKALKASCMSVSGVFFIVGGILVLIPVSWSSISVVRDFYNPVLISAQRREIGASLYTGFAAAALLIIAGAIAYWTTCFPRSPSRMVPFKMHGEKKESSVKCF